MWLPILPNPKNAIFIANLFPVDSGCTDAAKASLAAQKSHGCERDGAARYATDPVPALHSRYDASVLCPRSKPNYPPTKNGESSASLAATKSAASARASGLPSTATLGLWIY